MSNFKVEASSAEAHTACSSDALRLSDHGDAGPLAVSLELSKLKPLALCGLDLSGYGRRRISKNFYNEPPPPHSPTRNVFLIHDDGGQSWSGNMRDDD